MKAFLTMSLFVLIVAIGHCQPYKKIPIDTNYFWRQFSNCGPQKFNYQLRYHSDTVMNGRLYNKYSLFGKSYGGTPCASFMPVGYLRQDTIARRVSILDDNMQEQPLYDFSKKKGDTLLSYSVAQKTVLTLTVTQMQSTVTPIMFWTSDGNMIVEGIGSYFGGLFGRPMRNNVSTSTECLVCTGYITPYKRDFIGEVHYPLQCGLIEDDVGLHEENQPNIKIYPIPTRSSVMIECAVCTGAEASVFNTLGERVVYAQFVSEMLPLNIGQLPSGVYYITIPVNDHLFVGKVIKQ